MKFQVDISYNFWRYGSEKNKVGLNKRKIEVTKGNNYNNNFESKINVMVIVYCTSPHWDLSTYEVSSWYFL